MDGKTVLLWAKRVICYLAGLFIMSMGIVLSVKSSLGVSPVSSLGNVLYQILGVDMGIEALSLGVCTTVSYSFYVLIEFLILRRDFKPIFLLQVLASLVVGFMVNWASAILAFLPLPQNYLGQLAYILAAIPVIAFGVMTYMAPSLILMPGEGVSSAVAKKTGKSIANCKSVTDSCMVVFSASVSLIYFKKLVGVREGTIIAAILVGVVMRFFMKLFYPALLRFVERETRIERAVSGTAENLALSPGKFIITISREYGCEGHIIAKKIAERLGIALHDRDLEALEVEYSGLPLDYIQAHEKSMAGTIKHGLWSSNYLYFDEELHPQEKLFAAYTKILRMLASKDESCVVVGRCGDYVLYRDPNAFRVFVHAPTAYRKKIVSAEKEITVEEASEDVKRTDRGRARFYEEFTGRAWGKMWNYNVTVDASVYGVDKSVDLICDAVKLWQEGRIEKAKAEKQA